MVAALVPGSEIKRFGRSRMTRAAIVVLVLLPLVYGALYLWAFWDPFGHVDKMPVALVNTDRGAVVNGQHINAGEEIVRSLGADDSLDWHVVDDAEARRGVEHGTYYFMLEMPPDFSEAIASPVTGQPRKADLIALYNDANNYVSTTIGRSALNQVLNAVETRISGQAVNQVLSVVVSSGAGIKQAADGARQLATGAAQLDDGVHRLSAGIDSAAPASRQLAVGAQQVSDGITEATEPLTALSQAVAQVGGDTAQLQQAGTAFQQVADQVGAIGTAQDAAATTLDSVIAQLQASADPIAQSAVLALGGARDQLKDHRFTPQIRQQMSDARDAAISLSASLRGTGSPLSRALDKLGGRGWELTNKLTRLRDGARQVASGSARLADGVAALKSGVDRLATGSGQLRSGSAELARKLEDGARQVPAWSPAQKNAIAATIGGPVELVSAHENDAPTFAAGMAPFFLTLALFFGALVLWMVLRPLQTRPIAAEVSALRVALASYLPAVMLAVMQAVILYCVVRFALGLHFAHPIATLAFMVLISSAFVAVTQAINALVGPAVGRVLIMALLMLQLVSAGGLYPVETTAGPFQVLHRYDPMAYGVNGLRQLVLGGIDYRLWQAVAVLSALLIVALAVSSLSARRNRMWNLTRLMPAIKI